MEKSYKFLLFTFFLLPLVIVYFTCDVDIFKSVIWGFIFSSLLMIISFFALKYAINRPVKIFLGAVVGGILFRLLAIIFTGYYVHYFTELNISCYFSSLLGYYLFFQFIEVMYFNRNLKKV